MQGAVGKQRGAHTALGRTTLRLGALPVFALARCEQRADQGEAWTLCHALLSQGHEESMVQGVAGPLPVDIDKPCCARPALLP